MSEHLTTLQALESLERSGVKHVVKGGIKAGVNKCTPIDTAIYLERRHNWTSRNNGIDWPDVAGSVVDGNVIHLIDNPDSIEFEGVPNNAKLQEGDDKWSALLLV